MDYIKEEAKDNEVIPIPWQLSEGELRCLEIHYLEARDNTVYLNVGALDSKQRNTLSRKKKKPPEAVFSTTDSELPWD